MGLSPEIFVATSHCTLARVKVEPILAELNRLRSDVAKDPTDIEWFALHHAFCFISYRMSEFQKYLDEVVKPADPVPGEHT